MKIEFVNIKHRNKPQYEHLYNEPFFDFVDLAFGCYVLWIGYLFGIKFSKEPPSMKTAAKKVNEPKEERKK